MVAWEILSFIPYTVFIPLCIYGNIVICKNSSSIFVQKRSLFLLNGLNYSFLAGIASSAYFHIYLYYLSHSDQYIHILITIYYYILSVWCILFFLLTKNWLIYWRYKWTVSILQNQWQSLINPNNDEPSTNFYIAYNNKYGKPSFVFKIAALCVAFECVCFITYFICRVTQQQTVEILAISLSMMFAFIFMAIYGVIAYKIPHYNDRFHIHSESKSHAKLLALLAIVITVFLCIDIIVGTEKIGRYSIGGILFPFTSSILCALSYISTFGVLKNNKDIVTDKANQGNTSFGCNIEAMLSNQQALNLFMNHLAKEFSMECLLFYIELCQYEQYLIQHNVDNTIKRLSVNKVKLIQFPAHIPISQVVQCPEYETSETAMKIKAHKLYKKYIESGTELEVNMSFDLRFRFSDLINNLPQFLEYKVKSNDLLLLFDKARCEMKTLLFYALHRFSDTPEFRSIQHILNKEIQVQKFVYNEDIEAKQRPVTGTAIVPSPATEIESPETPLVAGNYDNNLMNTKIFLPTLDETHSAHLQITEIRNEHQTSKGDDHGADPMDPEQRTDAI